MLIDSYYPELFWYHPGFGVLSWSDAHLVAVAAGGRSGWAHSLRKLLAGSMSDAGHFVHTAAPDLTSEAVGRIVSAAQANR